MFENYDLLRVVVLCKMIAKIKHLQQFCKNIFDFACNLILIMYLCGQIKHKLKNGTSN